MLGRVPKAFPIHHLSFFNVSDFIPRYVMLLQCFSAVVTPTFMQGWSDTFVGIVLRPLTGSQMAIYTCAKVLHRLGIHSTWHGVLIILFPARRGGEVFLETSPEARHAHGGVGCSVLIRSTHFPRSRPLHSTLLLPSGLGCISVESWVTEKHRVWGAPGLGHVWSVHPDEELGSVPRYSNIDTTVESLS